MISKTKPIISIFTLKSKAIIVAITAFCLIWAFFISSNIAWACDDCSNWANKSYTTKSYNIAKKAFNSQKQAIIDAYNVQVDKISVYGLKTKDNFHGLRFKTGFFENSLDDIKDAISLSFENSHIDVTNQRKAEISKLVDKLNRNVAAKIAKIKAFYNARIGKIYDSLQNGQKVDFDSFKEYNVNGKEGNFSHKDFDFIDSKFNSEVNATAEIQGLFFVVVLIIGFIMVIVFGGYCRN